MTGKLEEAAYALHLQECEDRCLYDRWFTTGWDGHAGYVQEVVAVLRAIRKPSAAMVKAAMWRDDRISAGNAESLWTDMIDALIAEAKP